MAPEISPQYDVGYREKRQTERMVITGARFLPSDRTLAVKPQRWVVWAAYAVPLCVLPSGLWRLAMSVGIPVGFSDAVLRSDYDLPGWGALYTLGFVIMWRRSS